MAVTDSQSDSQDGKSNFTNENTGFAPQNGTKTSAGTGAGTSAETGSEISPVKPPSGWSPVVGWLGVAGLLVWVTIARLYGMDGRYSALTCVLAAGIPMVAWSIFVDKVHRNPTTGIDWDGPPRAFADIKSISFTKIAGLWATWAIIAFVYCIARWYWRGDYVFAMDVLMGWMPFIALITIPYVIWLDRRLREPKDGAYAFGAWLLGRKDADREEIYRHWRAWGVKGFFIAFMLSIVPGNFAGIINMPLDQIAGDPVRISMALINLMFLFDVHVAMVGYLLTMKPLDSHIRSANPFLAGWVAALICYPPFVMMGEGSILDYRHATYGDGSWAQWMAGQPLLLAVYGTILVFLTGVYAWATIAFGLRFSNLTHRGVLTDGPYAFVRHPAYISKNSFWWLATLPFLVTNGNMVDMVRNTVMLALVSGVYYWRAKTEEKHLLADPAYVAYWNWAERYAPVTKTLNRLFRKTPRTAVLRTGGPPAL